MTSARTAATDGTWMDLPTAAAYAGVPIPVLARAIHDRELEFGITSGRGGGALRVERTDIEMWAERRESALI